MSISTMIVGATAMSAAAATGFGVAAVTSEPPGPDETGAFHACVRENGALRLVDADQSCRKQEAAVTWQEAGPAGPPGPPGETGPAGPEGPQGPAGTLTGYEIVEETIEIGPGSVALWWVECPAGKRATGGGFSTMWGNLDIGDNGPLTHRPSSGWMVGARAHSDQGDELTVYAVCVDG